MSTIALVFLCFQACLVQNALSTLIGPAVYGNGFGLGNSAGAGLTAASAELAGWYGCDSPARYGAYPLEREIEREIAYSPWAAREMAGPFGGPLALEAPFAGPFAAPLLEAPFAGPCGSPYASPILEAPFAYGPYASPMLEGPLAGPYGAPWGERLAGPYAYETIGAYGGEGIGDVAVAGEMPVAGTTLVSAQVPILGAVRFGGDLPAGGVVSIAGRCGCGCAY